MLLIVLVIIFQVSLSFNLNHSFLRGFKSQQSSNQMKMNNNPSKIISKTIASTLLGLGLLSSTNNIAPVSAASTTTSTTSISNTQQQVYFGVGCFWHVQHEFVEAERSILSRSDSDLTAYAGYAGGKSTGKDSNNPTNKNGVVCYHNMMGIGDYGGLGHGEVVKLDIPTNTIGQFADTYFSLYGKDSERPDKGDRGGEYRSLIGLPGGINSPLMKDIQSSLDRSGKKLKLVEGNGNDKDTLGKGIVYVMDTGDSSGGSGGYPFYPGELYHQFHDGFMPGEQYPQSYNR